MIEIIVVATLTSIVIPIYVYAGYPALLVTLSKLGKPTAINYDRIEPDVSMIVSCYNEQEIIADKIDNCLKIDYPENKLEFIFVSDASDDETDDIIRRYEGDRLRLIRQEGRLGKTMGLNLAVPECRGDIVVFSDANAIYRKDAIRKLVRNFSVDKIGYVVGAALYADERETLSGASENTYWQYEIFIKTIESRMHSVVGGDGAIYAIRKELYQRLDREDINDFANPLQIIAAGFRGVFEPEAICFEESAGSFELEAIRKRRIVNRSFSALMKNPAVLNPARFGFFSISVVSHKLLRWLVPFFAIIAVAGTLVLAGEGLVLFQILLLLEIIAVWLIMLGYLLRHRSGTAALVLYPYYFYKVNLSSMQGIIDSLRGKVQVTWSTPRAKLEDIDQSRMAGIAMQIIVLVITALLFLETLGELI